MREILQTLNEMISARGSIVLAPDGMRVISEVREGVDEDRLSALGAAVVIEIGDTLKEAGYERFTQIEIATAEGKVILVEAGPTNLLVLLGARLEIGPGSIEIRSAAQRVAKAANLAAT